MCQNLLIQHAFQRWKQIIKLFWLYDGPRNDSQFSGMKTGYKVWFLFYLHDSLKFQAEPSHNWSGHTFSAVITGRQHQLFCDLFFVRIDHILLNVTTWSFTVSCMTIRSPTHLDDDYESRFEEGRIRSRIKHGWGRLERLEVRSRENAKLLRNRTLRRKRRTCESEKGEGTFCTDQVR